MGATAVLGALGSKVWWPINQGEIGDYLEPPLQYYYMNHGGAMSPFSYRLQGAIVAVLVLALPPSVRARAPGPPPHRLPRRHHQVRRTSRDAQQRAEGQVHPAVAREVEERAHGQQVDEGQHRRLREGLRASPARAARQAGEPRDEDQPSQPRQLAEGKGPEPASSGGGRTRKCHVL